MKRKGFQLNWISQYRDELFGIAIISVLFLHFAMLHIAHYKGSQDTMFLIIRWIRRYISSSGVDIFVFLSGMGLYYSLSKNEDIKSFYGRRYRRILVPYVIVGGIFWTHVDLFTRAVGLRRLICDFCFITFFAEGVNNLWFIGCISIMYFIFPFVYQAVFCRRLGKLWLVLLFSFSVLFPAVMYRITPELYKNINIAITRMPIFLLGTAAGKYIKEKKSVPTAAIVWLILTGFFCKHYVLENHIKGYWSRYAASMFAISMLLICVYVLKVLDRAKYFRTGLRFFGRYSLEFYLLHILLWQLLSEANWKLYQKSSYFWMVCMCMLLAPILGKLTKVIIHNIMTRHEGVKQP